MNSKKVILLLLASLLSTIAVYRYVKKAFIGPQNEEVLAVLPDTVLFTKHVAPIIFKHCSNCHRSEGPAPFRLSGYTDVMRKKKTIVKVIKEGIMPPWPADPSYSHFIGENVLSDLEKNTIYKWAEQGFIKGADFHMPPAPKFSPYSMIGTPDLTLYMDSILVKGNNHDRFLVVKIPGELTSDTFIRAIEFVPGKHQLVHHLNGHLLNYDPALKVDVYDGTRVAELDLHPMEKEEEFGALKLYNDDGTTPELIRSAVNYLPGVIGLNYPEGIGGYKLSKKFALVANDLHYAPITENKWDRSHFNLFFSSTPPKRSTKEMSLGTNGVSPVMPALDIAPDSILHVSSRYRTTNDLSILTINPHMHLLGRSFKAYAILPDGDTLPFIRIKRWDFRWQYFYTFPKMMFVPAGSLIVAEGVFDNTKNNPNNPYSPPIRIKERLDLDGAGMRTTDEMFQFIITYLDYEKGDENFSLEN